MEPTLLPDTKPTALTVEDTRSLTRLFYGSIGFAASLALFLVFYWSLRLNASIENLIRNFLDVPLYFWPYVVFTLAAIVLFGVNVSLLVYRWRRYGRPRLRGQGSTGLGALIGVAASACPVCGSVLLSAIGITGGLAAFPLAGLELKALSVVFLLLPLWLIRRDLKNLDEQCAVGASPAEPPVRRSLGEVGWRSGVCPNPRDASFKDTDRPWLLAVLALIVALGIVTWRFLTSDPAIARLSRSREENILNAADNRLNTANVQQTDNPLFNEVVAKVLPESGFQSTIRLGDSVVRLVEQGVIDRAKFENLYKDRGGLPTEVKTALDHPTETPMLLTRENANYYVNFLWPLGLANKMSSNERSPINGKSLFNLASTGGWNLGKEENGGAYFNKFVTVPLTPEQETLVTKIAENTYRPCCNNSTFYQDCNHGSALLGLLQLGASQGLTEDELYREALAFNAFWFPHNYLQTALYFKSVKNTDWEDVDPRVVLGKDYSTISGWSGTVAKEVATRGLVPQAQGGAGCGV